MSRGSSVDFREFHRKNRPAFLYSLHFIPFTVIRQAAKHNLREAQDEKGGKRPNEFGSEEHLEYPRMSARNMGVK